MFKGLTKDLAGTADICSIATDVRKLQAHTYLVGTGEEIVFAFASGKDEFAFTNEALITVRGENATTTRRVVERLELRDHALSNVKFETTGRVDRDCELKFTLRGDQNVSIDIAKKEEDAAKRYYKALVALAREQEHRARMWSFAQTGLERATQSLKLHATADAGGLPSHATQTLEWLTSDFERINPRCFKDVLVRALSDAPQ